MPTLHIGLVDTISRAERVATGVEMMPVCPSEVRVAQTMTTTGTSVESTLEALHGELWVVTARDADHWINFGAAAGPGFGHLIMMGATREFSAKEKQKIHARTA